MCIIDIDAISGNPTRKSSGVKSHYLDGQFTPRDNHTWATYGMASDGNEAIAGADVDDKFVCWVGMASDSNEAIAGADFDVKFVCWVGVGCG